MNNERIRLVLLSVGSLVGTGVLECIDDLGRERFEVIGLNSDATASNNFRCDVCYLAPGVRDRDALLALLDSVVERHAPELVIPCRDDDVVALSIWKSRGAVAPAMVGSVAMAEIIRDKWKSYQWASSNGLPFAKSAIDREGLDALRNEFGLPLVAKPRLGFGSNGVRLLFTDEHCANALAAEGTVVQQAISPSPTLSPEALRSGIPLWFAPIQPGSPLAISLLDERGAHFVSITTSRHVRGAAIDNLLLDAPEYRDTLMRYSEVAWRDSWRGLFSIQARLHTDGRYIPIELAGRFMGATSALQALGVQLFERVLTSYVPRYEQRSTSTPNFALRIVKQVRTHAHLLADEQTLALEGAWIKR
jgi:hypothetical protein